MPTFQISCLTKSEQPAFARRLIVFALLAIIPLMLAGCGQRDQSDGPAALVAGTVTLDGQPLTSGCVTFIPELSEADGGRPGVARVESDGYYRIGNADHNRRRRFRPGRYKITVLSLRTSAGMESPAIAELALPEIYTDYRTTPLAAEVIEGENRVDIQLALNPRAVTR